jgi:large subunit ribosomal protein L29
MKIKEIKELTDNEILERMETDKDHLIRLKLNHSISPLDNPSQIKAARRTIARFNTELRQRELNQNQN